MPQAITKLLSSSKAWILIAVIGLYIASMRLLTPEQVESLRQLLVVIVPGWMVAHAGESGAKHLANGKLPTHTDVAASVGAALMALGDDRDADPDKTRKTKAANDDDDND